MSRPHRPRHLLGFPDINIPQVYVTLDSLPDPRPRSTRAYGKVKHLDSQVAIIEAEGTRPVNPGEEEEDFDNCCLCHAFWTSVDGVPAESLNEKLMKGEIVDFTFRIWEVRGPSRPLFCTVDDIIRQPLVFYLKKPKDETKSIVKGDKGRDAARYASSGRSSKDDRPKKFVVKIKPEWSAKQVQGMRNDKANLTKAAFSALGEVKGEFVESSDSDEDGCKPNLKLPSEEVRKKEGQSNMACNSLVDDVANLSLNAEAQLKSGAAENSKNGTETNVERTRKRKSKKKKSAKK